MENCKKMLLITPETMEKLKKESISETPLSRLDNEMQNILKTKMQDREKWKLYLQVLQRFLHFSGEQRLPLHVPIISQVNSNATGDSMETQNKYEEHEEKPKILNEPLMTKDVHRADIISKNLYSPEHLLKLIPKSYSRKGELVLKLLTENQNKICWNDNGVISINNQEVKGSNIGYLINDILRPLQKIKDPLGWEKFADLLRDLKIPLSCIGNPERLSYVRKSMLKDFRVSSQSNTPESDIEPRTTPKKTEQKIRKKIEWEKWTPY